MGNKSYLGVTSDSLIASGTGRLVNLTITDAGSAEGAVYDAATVQEADASNMIAVIPTTTGIMTLNFPFTNGLVVKPGTGQSISLTYS